MIGRHLDVMYPKVQGRKIGEEILRVEHFKVPHTFAFGKNIIEDVSFSLKRGEILGLAGLVGAGRSELVNALFGAIPKTNGKIYMEGREINIRSPRDAKKYGIGLLTEDRKKNGFIGTMSIKHNMTLTVLKEITSMMLINPKKEQEKAQTFYDTRCV